MTDIPDEAIEAALDAAEFCRNANTRQWMHAALLAAAPFIRAAEREECALIASRHEGEYHSDLADLCAREIAAAIRARQSEGESKS